LRKRTPSGWQPTDEIYPESDYPQRYPVIAVDSNDYLHVAWQGKSPSSPDHHQIRYRKYSTSWSAVETLTSASVDQEAPNLIWAWWPVVNGLRTNRPKEGYAFVWNDGADIKFHKSSDLEFEKGPDTTPPIVSRVSPENDATDVSVDTVVTATFSEAMDSSTIAVDSFTLSGSAVSGTVTYNSDTYTATLTPDANLEYNHQYTATLSTAITDAAGNPLAAAYTWPFTTRAAPVPGTIYVPDDYPTIQAAVDAASSGGTIIVRDGIYTENVDVNKDHLTIQSENGAEVTTVQAANPDDHVFEVTGDYVNLNGFTVEGAAMEYSYYPISGIYLYYADYCNISNNNASNNFAGIGLRYSGNNRIVNNIASNTGYNGIWLSFSNDNTIKNNIASNDSYYSINLTFSGNNTISNNALSITDGVCLNFSNNNKVYLNNLPWANASYESSNIWSSPQPMTYKYNGKNYTGLRQ